MLGNIYKKEDFQKIIFSAGTPGANVGFGKFEVSIRFAPRQLSKAIETERESV